MGLAHWNVDRGSLKHRQFQGVGRAASTNSGSVQNMGAKDVEDVAPNPRDIGFLGAQTVMEEAQGVADLVKKPPFGRGFG